MASYEHPKIAPKIVFYTNPDCPWCQRVHILLAELELPFEMVYIDLTVPRPQWYLDINPRGLVPAISYTNGPLENEIIYESGIVSQFLADMRPSHILPASLSAPDAPLVRARTAFFVDTFMGKVPGLRALLMAPEAERENQAREIAKIVAKEVEPLLAETGAEGPFFGGKKEMGMAEVLTAPFLLRMYALSRQGTYVSPLLREELEKVPAFSRWAKAVLEAKSVKENWDEERVLSNTGRMVEKIKASQQQAKA